ncbi:MAG: MFS transporter [Bdellovibrionales bacterium]
MSNPNFSISTVTNKSLVFVSYLTLFSLGLLDNARGPFFADIISDIKLTDTQASLFYVVVSSMAFFMGVLVPRLLNVLSLLNVLRIGQVLMGVGFAAISLSSNLTELIITCVVFGVGFGLINVTQNLLILEAASESKRRRLLSGLHGMYAISSLVAPLIAALLFKNHIGWRTAFFWFSLLGFASFISTFFVKYKSKMQTNQKVLKNPNRSSYFIFGSMLSLYIITEILISSRLPLYVRRFYNYSPVEASNLLAVFFLFLFLGRIIFLLVPMKTASLKIIEFSLLATGAMLSLGLWVHPWFLTLCGLTMASVFGLSVDYLAETFPKYSADAIAYCLALSCVYIVSMHLVTGFVTDHFGVHVAMQTSVVYLICSWLCLLMVKKKV